MPGPKGVRRPEPSANRMAIRDRESYPAVGWLSEDERLAMMNDGLVLIQVDPVEMEWDEDNRQFVIRIDSIDGDRMIRWLRHGLESVGICADIDLEHLRR